MIEECGLKGLRIGGAVVSEKHANFILNDKKASATDIEDLIELVRDTVYKKTGITLEREVKIIGKSQMDSTLKILNSIEKSAGKILVVMGSSAERDISIKVVRQFITHCVTINCNLVYMIGRARI